MKLILSCLLLLSFFVKKGDKIATEEQQMLSTQLGKLRLVGDSGFFLKTEGVEILEQLGMSDGKDVGWKHFSEQDTIGRYFRSNESGHYLLCIIDVQDKIDFETHVLIELKQKGESSFKVLATERYQHGNYPCCWNNSYEGFRRFGNYFTFSCCGTGSGFCGENLYYFKKIRSQKQSRSIRDNYWSVDETGAMKLSSEKELAGEKLIYRYQIEHFVWKNEEKLEAREKDTFSISYQMKNNKYLCDDSLYEKVQF